MILFLAPNLRQRRYNEIADKISVNACHLLWFLLEVAEDGKVDPDKLRARITQSGHDWTQAQVQAFLHELATACCLTFR
jgi:predicted transcriptional regulator